MIPLSVQVKPLFLNLEYCSHKDRTKSPSNDTNGSNSSITQPNSGVRHNSRNSRTASRMKLSHTAFKNLKSKSYLCQQRKRLLMQNLMQVHKNTLFRPQWLVNKFATVFKGGEASAIPIYVTASISYWEKYISLCLKN